MMIPTSYVHKEWMRYMCFCGCPHEKPNNSFDEAVDVCNIEGDAHDGEMMFPTPQTISKLN